MKNLLSEAVKAVNTKPVIGIVPSYWCTSCNTFPENIDFDERCKTVIQTSEDGDIEPCNEKLKKVTIVVLED